MSETFLQHIPHIFDNFLTKRQYKTTEKISFDKKNQYIIKKRYFFTLYK